MNFFQLNEALENGIGYKIFCDLDGVLVDLERGISDHFGIEKSISNQKIQELLDKLEESDVDMEDFFQKLH